MPTERDTINSPNPSVNHWLSGKQLAIACAAAIGCFHLAYCFKSFGILGFAIGGYVIAVTQLARAKSKRFAFYSALVTAFACFAPQLSFFWGLFGSAAIVLWLILALWIAVFVLLTRIAISNLGWFRAAFLTPFFWTGLEYFRSELYYLRFSWLDVGYAFSEALFLPWRYVGTYGIGFLSALMGGGVLLLNRSNLRKLRPIEWFTLVGIVLFFTSVGVTTMIRRIEPPNLIVAGVQLEFPDEAAVVPALDLALAEFQSRSQTNALSKTHTNLDLVVLPEYTLSEEPPQTLRDWCRTNQKFLVVGGKQNAGETNFFNTAFVISTNGEIVFRQGKSVPIQFFKDGLPAPEQKIWSSPWGRIGICICYDLSYTRVTDNLVKQGAQLLIVPTMDLVDWGARQHELHGRVAPVRAAEYGIPIFRVASSGISQGVEASGTVQAHGSFPGEGEVVFFATNIQERGSVPADRLLALLCVGITVIFIVRTAAATLEPIS